MTTLQTSARIQVIVEVVEDDGTTFRDALYMSEAEHAAKTPEEITAMAQARYDNWKAVVANPPVAPPLTTEQQEAQFESMLDQQDLLDSAIAAIPDVIANAVLLRRGKPIRVEAIEEPLEG